MKSLISDPTGNVRGVDVESDGALARTHDAGAFVQCVKEEDVASVTSGRRNAAEVTGRVTSDPTGNELGQATAEYALVVVAAAAVAGALIVWATTTGALGSLFDAVIERVSSLV